MTLLMILSFIIYTSVSINDIESSSCSFEIKALFALPNKISPEIGGTIPERTRNRVLFPHPLGPQIAVTDPAGKTILICSKTGLASLL